MLLVMSSLQEVQESKGLIASVCLSVLEVAVKLTISLKGKEVICAFTIIHSPPMFPDMDATASPVCRSQDDHVQCDTSGVV